MEKRFNLVFLPLDDGAEPPFITMTKQRDPLRCVLCEKERSVAGVLTVNYKDEVGTFKICAACLPLLADTLRSSSKLDGYSR